MPFSCTGFIAVSCLVAASNLYLCPPELLSIATGSALNLLDVITMTDSPENSWVGGNSFLPPGVTVRIPRRRRRCRRRSSGGRGQPASPHFTNLRTEENPNYSPRMAGAFLLLFSAFLCAFPRPNFLQDLSLQHNQEDLITLEIAPDLAEK